MNFFKMIWRGLKNVFSKGKLALIISIGVAGSILVANSIINWLPEIVSNTFQLLMGLGLIILAGWLSSMLIKRR